MASHESELATLRSALEELKQVSASVEEDLYQEVAQLEQQVTQRDATIRQMEHALDEAAKKAEQAREYSTRYQLSLEKQVQTLEKSGGRMKEEYYRMEQQKENVERAQRVLQDQYEDLGQNYETAVSRAAILDLALEEKEQQIHSTQLEHESVTLELRGRLQMLSSQLTELGHTPVVGVQVHPDPTPDSAITEGAPPEADKSLHAKLLFCQVRNKMLQAQLVGSRTELSKAQSRIRELESLPGPNGVQPVAPVSEEKTVSLVPEVPTTAPKTVQGVIVEGYLVKRGDGAFATWEQRLFKINHDLHVLEYFFIQVSKKTTKVTKLGEIALPGASITVAMKEGTHDNLFQIKPRFSKKIYVIQAASAEERAGWLLALGREMDRREKVVADSILEDTLKVGTSKDNLQSMFCVLLKHSFQYFKVQTDPKPQASLPLSNWLLAKPNDGRPDSYVFLLEHGPGFEVEQVFVDCGDEDKLARWTEQLAQIGGTEQKEGKSVGRHERTMSSDGDEGLMQGMMAKHDPSTKRWTDYFFTLSTEDSLLKFYGESDKATGQPIGVIPLLNTQQGGTCSAAIITSHPSDSFNREHLLGITLPFSTLTIVLQAKSEQDKLRWLDGLVSFLDSKVARDPYSTKEGYLYKQRMNATSKWSKKYVILGLPEFKYFKAGQRHSNARALTLTPESQVVVQSTFPKKFAFAFSLRETPDGREFFWASPNQAQGESWASTIQAAIVKLRQHKSPASPVPVGLGLSRAPVENTASFVLQAASPRIPRRVGRLRSATTDPTRGVESPTSIDSESASQTSGSHSSGSFASGSFVGGLGSNNSGSFLGNVPGAATRTGNMKRFFGL